MIIISKDHKILEIVPSQFINDLQLFTFIRSQKFINKNPAPPIVHLSKIKSLIKKKHYK